MRDIASEARLARRAEGLSQTAVSKRAGVSQSSISRLEAGDPGLTLAVLDRALSAVGLDLVVRAYPGSGVPLRDSGQLALTDVIRAAAHSAWAARVEMPVGDGSRRAADLVLLRGSFGLHVEIESALVDFQAQLRRGQLKRVGLEQHLGMKLAFVLALGESKRNRAAVHAAEGVVRMALPASAREVMAALRGGLPLARDGLLWVRPPRAGIRTGVRPAAHPRVDDPMNDAAFLRRSMQRADEAPNGAPPVRRINHAWMTSAMRPLAQSEACATGPGRSGRSRSR